MKRSFFLCLMTFIFLFSPVTTSAASPWTTIAVARTVSFNSNTYTSVSIETSTVDSFSAIRIKFLANSKPLNTYATATCWKNNKPYPNLSFNKISSRTFVLSNRNYDYCMINVSAYREIGITGSLKILVQQR